MTKQLTNAPATITPEELARLAALPDRQRVPVLTLFRVVLASAEKQAHRPPRSSSRIPPTRSPLALEAGSRLPILTPEA